MNIKIRQEEKEDYEQTEEVVKEAFLHAPFSDGKEHELVSRLRKSEAFVPALSLVAVEADIIGHILLSEVKIINEDRSTISLALAPISVKEEYQGKGIGKQLITEALKRAKELGYESVIVLGHENYYPKFGFKRASLWGIQAPFEVPDEAFMALQLQEGALQNVSGVVQYSKAFFE
ncbi:GNAT family N-acetyltransferase [Bacillus manliponensis]|uniref:GNAT family N-acetyltransferase n=1 Tax=Bacillus manliponensis TaxID=574376 RepID=UPI003519838F